MFSLIWYMDCALMLHTGKTLVHYWHLAGSLLVENAIDNMLEDYFEGSTGAAGAIVVISV